jgi:AKAP7 2'5' RNA ligase-like domain
MFEGIKKLLKILLFMMAPKARSLDVILSKTARFHVYHTKSKVMKQKCVSSGIEIEKRPNFFVGIKLDGLVEKVDALQAQLRNDARNLHGVDISKTLTSSKKMHFTAFVMALNNEDQIAEAGAILSEIKLDRSASVMLTKVELIGTNVMYIAPDKEDAGFLYMKSVVRRLFERFQEKKLVQFRNLNMPPDQWIDQWLPHATIAKTSADRRNGRKIKFCKELIGQYEDYFEGLRIPLHRIDLLEMGRNDDDGYYRSHASTQFPRDQPH